MGTTTTSTPATAATPTLPQDFCRQMRQATDGVPLAVTTVDVGPSKSWWGAKVGGTSAAAIVAARKAIRDNVIVH
eukprot:COSAG02_NODE_5618_length_4179_cov_6.208333_4_plen_75_part_00